jgi:hypothetical protein
MNAWVLKAIHKVGLAGRRNRRAELPKGKVLTSLLKSNIIMIHVAATAKKPASYMLTAMGQALYTNIKFK